MTTPKQKAIDFLNDNPTEKMTVAAKIYGVNVDTLRMRLRRVRQRRVQPETRGGSNKVLSYVQEQAIQRYI